MLFESIAVRILHERLPDLLASPLPQDILSPEITLHLFPSTHPHLPTVSGRIPYTGALWTAPIAWNRIPVVGNVKIEPLSQRMVSSHDVRDRDRLGEKLIVRWRTHDDRDHEKSGFYSQTAISGTSYTNSAQKQYKDKNDKTFHGLFIFEFDDQGRIIKHTIEHVEEGRNLDHMTSVVSVTDWLLGHAPWKRNHELPQLAWCDGPQDRQSRFVWSR